MEFLSENKKRFIALFAVSALILGGLFYVYQSVRRASNISISGGVTRAQEEASSLLPFGSKLNLQVLKSPKFTILRMGPKVQVSPEELGKSNLFETE